MISNTPSSSDYKKIAIECWVQVIDSLYDIERYLGELDLDSEIDFTTLADEIYEFSQPHYKTAIVLLHQGVEAIMKGKVCDVSPLLLIDNKRTDWPVRPNQGNKSFSEFFTIGAEELLNTFCAIANPPLDSDTVDFLERIRKLRNKIIHGLTAEIVDSRTILSDVMNSFTIFFGKDSWWRETRQVNWEHPLFTFFNSDLEVAEFASRLEFVLKKIGKGEFARHSSFPIKQRRYLCPDCKYNYERKVGPYEYKWATLKPNTATSTTVGCYNCDKESTVIRRDCLKEGCKGNVISEEYDFCLTCGKYQEA